MTLERVRVLYSFPHKLGADRICYTAWQQVNGLAAAGADLLVMPGVLHRAVPADVAVRQTLAWGKARVSYKLLGTMRACALHDHIVSRRLEKLAGKVDIVHTWPLGALQTLRVAARLRIPAVLERPNAHTRFAYEVVKRECDRLGVILPANHEHAYKARVLSREEEEYEAAYRLLCPSDFVATTFSERGFAAHQLVRHQYGFDDQVYRPASDAHSSRLGLTVLFVGVCAVRKGLHHALEAWLRSSASRTGRFLIAGAFVPDYEKYLAPMLAHPSVRVLGHRDDVPTLLRDSDVFILPTIEEGSPLACLEALGSGCVPLVSDVCRGICRQGYNSLIHKVGDVSTLAEQITLLDHDRDYLARLRSGALESRPGITWDAAGRSLLGVYRQLISALPSYHDDSSAYAVSSRVSSGPLSQ